MTTADMIKAISMVYECMIFGVHATMIIATVKAPNTARSQSFKILLKYPRIDDAIVIMA